MLIKFDNPSNGRFYYMFQHYEGERPVLTIVRGGQKRKAVENYFYDNISLMQQEVERKKKRRIQRGYLQSS